MNNDFITTVEILLIIIVAVVVVFTLISGLAFIWKLVLLSRYNRFNKQKVTVGMTGSQIAEKMLEGLGLTDVKVEKLGFWKALFFGNSYNPKKKSIQLRNNIFDKSSLTAVAIASQKVAIAQKHHEGDKKIAIRSTLMKFGYFAPFALLPLILIGILLDYVVWQRMGWLSIIFTVVGFAYFLISFIIVIMNLKIEKAACKTSLEFMKKTNVLTDDELEDAQYLYKTYITDYWLEFLYDVAYIIWEILKLVTRLISLKNKK